nr:unnamed protein product [Callosobruchus analis]
MDCYPDELSIRVTEICAEVKLQDLLNHTCLRLFIYLEPVIETATQEEKSDLEIFVKWGSDGSQQSQFKVKFENAADTDSNIFQSSLVPLRLQWKSSKKIFGRIQFLLHQDSADQYGFVLLVKVRRL